MKKLLSLLFCLAAMIPLRAITPMPKPNAPLRWSGYVVLENFYDTRDIVSFREDIFLLYPKQKVLDAFGSDINNHPKFNMAAVRTRMRVEADGPDVHSYAASMMIEGEFMGPIETTYGAFRLRHAYGKLENEKARVIFGQYWHPMRAEDCMAQVVSYNDGAPIELYARDPQIRYVYKHGKWELLGALLEQSPGFESFGPDTPGESSIYLRRAIVPNIHGQLRYVTDERIFGIGVDYKRLVPRIVNNVGNTTTEHVNEFAATAYFVQKLCSVTLRMQGIYAQDQTALLGFGGYAVTDVNPLTNEQNYSPLQDVNAWFDVTSNDERLSPGLFVGVSKNLGTLKRINTFGPDGQPIVYGRNPNIDYVVRVAPRVVWTLGQFQIGLECEYTGASYGRLDLHGKVRHGSYVDNLRALLDLFYYF